jgi:hypothetical protein
VLLCRECNQNCQWCYKRICPNCRDICDRCSEFFCNDCMESHQKDRRSEIAITVHGKTKTKKISECAFREMTAP